LRGGALLRTEAAFRPLRLIKELHFNSSIDVWGYFSVNNSGNIHEYADSRLNIFASGADRGGTRRRLIPLTQRLKIRVTSAYGNYIIKMLQV
jgi:acetyl-CoA carboxylase/biotin carboxylase 1